MRRELALALALIGCGPAAAPCPSGTQSDPPRAHEIQARLATVSEGRALIDAARAQVPAICFGARASSSVITRDRVVLLATDLEEGEAAARLGHLLVHARDGLPVELVHTGLDADACHEAVRRALMLEARAYVTEITLQDALVAEPVTLAFAFSDAVRASSTQDERESVVLAYLYAHPDGGRGVDGLLEAYRARCR